MMKNKLSGSLIKELTDDLEMVEDDIYKLLDKEPYKCDSLHNSGYILGRVIRVLKSLDSTTNLWYNS